MWSNSSKGGPGELIRTICRSCLWRKVVPPLSLPRDFQSGDTVLGGMAATKKWDKSPILRMDWRSSISPSRGILCESKINLCHLRSLLFWLIFYTNISSQKLMTNQFPSPSCLFIGLHFPGRIGKGKDILVERNILPNHWQSNNYSHKNVHSHLKNTFYILMPQRGVTLHSEREISFLKFSSLKCLWKRKGNTCSKEIEKEKNIPRPLRLKH